MSSYDWKERGFPKKKENIELKRKTCMQNLPRSQQLNIIKMDVDSLFRPIELAYQLAPVQDAAKHGGLK